MILVTYLVLGKSYRTGCAVWTVIQVLVVGCIVGDVDWQNKTARENSTQGVVHLMRHNKYFSFMKQKNQFNQGQISYINLKKKGVALSNLLTSSKASPDLRRFWIL